MSLPVAPAPRHFEHRILAGAAKIVPAGERDDWCRGWQAELWYLHDRCRRQRRGGPSLVADLSIGIVRDALWLRMESWRCALRGSAALCLVSLLGLSLLSTGLALLLEGSWHLLSPQLIQQFQRSLLAAPLVVFVAFATASRRYVEQASLKRKLLRVKRCSFFALKMIQVLLLAFLISADACAPVRGPLPGLADLLQLFWFVSLALLGLRWTFTDQELRCKHCLQSLEMPFRVGRPSHNLLEWNGSELSCKWGHGLLSIPEIETSWCRSSRWTGTQSE